MSRTGMVPRQEDIPLTIDAQYVPGFIFTREPQLRIAKDFLNHTLWAGVSIESPQANDCTGPNGTGAQSGTVNLTNPGGSNFSPTVNYSDEVAPEIVAKIAWDPGWGHYEVYGVARFLHDRVSVVGGGRNHTVPAGGGGAGVILPLIKGKLELEGRFLAGVGTGRYGAGQLPDATVGRDGSPVPLPEVIALAGLVGHPIPSVDLYSYVGTEQIGQRSFTTAGKGYGYGSPLYTNIGCGVELSTAGCVANTSGLVQGTLGGWWRFLKGDYGTMEVGGQYSYTRRTIFGAIGGHSGTDENTVMLSLRYLPFQ